MSLQQRAELRWYFALFNFIAEKRIKNNDLDLREIHAHLVVMLTTGILMWAYAFVAWFTITSRVPGIVGFICSTLHTLSPLLFRVSRSRYLAANVLIGAGMLHQSTFAFYTGGFESHVLIWFGILPMLGSVMSGIKGAVTWASSTVIIALTYLVLHLNGFNFPHEISEAGALIGQVLLVFGWIFLSTSIVIVYIGLRSNTELLLEQQSKKIDDLFRVLFHDLANPLGRVAIGISIAKRQTPNAEVSRGLEIAKAAADAMIDITQNVRKMYAISKGKVQVDLVYTPFAEALEYAVNIYASDLEKKKLKVNYDPHTAKVCEVLVEPVSFKNQVLGNIISNAIKFSPEGSEISVHPYLVSQGLVAIEVKDQGIGIPKEILPHLFDIHKKTSRTGTQGESGTGLGMSIIKSFVEMYDGEIFVTSVVKDSDAPSGTTITLTLKGNWKE